MLLLRPVIVDLSKYLKLLTVIGAVAEEHAQTVVIRFAVTPRSLLKMQDTGRKKSSKTPGIGFLSPRVERCRRRVLNQIL